MSWLDVTSGVAATATHERMSNPVPIVPTGLKAIDKAFLSWGQAKGIPRGTYGIVGGASNAGKTQFGLRMAINAASAGERAGLVSLDMKEKDALLRIHQAVVPSIDGNRWRPDLWDASLEAELRDGLVGWRESIDGDLGIDAVPVGDLNWVRESIEKGIEAGVTFFVVDHLQKIRVEGVRGPADRAELISEALDNYCDEHDVTILGLSQLNREASRDRNRSPIMQDLLGGTSLESNAQIVIMLDHARYARDERHHHLGRTFVMLDKNQMGPKNFDVAVEVNHATLGYREALDDEMHRWPELTR